MSIHKSPTNINKYVLQPNNILGQSHPPCTQIFRLQLLDSFLHLPITLLPPGSLLLSRRGRRLWRPARPKLQGLEKKTQTAGAAGAFRKKCGNTPWNPGFRCGFCGFHSDTARPNILRGRMELRKSMVSQKNKTKMQATPKWPTSIHEILGDPKF